MMRYILAAAFIALAAPAHAGLWGSIKGFFSGNAHHQTLPAGYVSPLDTHTKATHQSRLAKARHDRAWSIVGGGVSGNYGTNGCQTSSCK